MDVLTTETLVAIAVVLLSYNFIKWLKNPLRKIPGPTGLPLFGNTFSINPKKLHMILYDWAEKYGDIMKISLFNTPIVVVNSTEMAYEVLGRTGTDFQGRPESLRSEVMIGKDLAFADVRKHGYQEMRSMSIKAFKAYGEGVAHLEKIIQDVTANLVQDITKRDGKPLDTDQLAYGYFCCVIASILYGEQYTYDDPVCQKLHIMNKASMKAVNPVSLGHLLDCFPVLFRQNVILKETIAQIRNTKDFIDRVFYEKINEYKSGFDETDMRGMLDQLILIQRQESGEGKQVMDDEAIRGILLNFVVGGMETSHTVTCQAFLDFLHEPELQKRLQDEIDSQCDSTHVITLQDRHKLPLLQAYIQENIRYKTVNPILLAHETIRDTEIAGYKIPSRTTVLINAFYTAHNPHVYDEPFKVKPERFLDENGNLVPPGHPARYNSLTFGSGKRVCIGKSFAESRLFLFLANILQKFTLQPVGKLPSRDLHTYELEIVLRPPSVSAKFIRRQ